MQVVSEKTKEQRIQWYVQQYMGRRARNDEQSARQLRFDCVIKFALCTNKEFSGRIIEYKEGKHG